VAFHLPEEGTVVTAVWLGHLEVDDTQVSFSPVRREGGGGGQKVVELHGMVGAASVVPPCHGRAVEKVTCGAVQTTPGTKTHVCFTFVGSAGGAVVLEPRRKHSRLRQRCNVVVPSSQDTVRTLVLLHVHDVVGEVTVVGASLGLLGFQRA